MGLRRVLVFSGLILAGAASASTGNPDSRPVAKSTRQSAVAAGPSASPQRRARLGSRPTVAWMRGHGVRFILMFSRQSYQVGGIHRFWGGLNVEAVGGGPGLVQALYDRAAAIGVEVRYRAKAARLLLDDRGALRGIVRRHMREVVALDHLDGVDVDAGMAGGERVGQPLCRDVGCGRRPRHRASPCAVSSEGDRTARALERNP